MNHCSLRCSYCADVIRNGSARLPDIRHCVDAVKQIRDHCDNQGFQSADFYITGGEVTEWPLLPELIAAIDDLGGNSRIRSNGQSELKIYDEIWRHLDAITLEFHPESAATAHFAQVIAAAIKNSVEVSVTVMMTPERWEELESWTVKIKTLWNDLPVNKRLLFANPVINTEPLAYSESQLAALINQTGDLEYWQDDQMITTDFAALAVHQLNRFSGSRCAAGLEQIVIDAWGKVYRGHCRQGGKLGEIGSEIKFPSEPRICDRPICNNGFDINATKY